MKARESLPNFDSKSRETTNFIIKSIKTVCRDFPSRPKGSQSEKNAQQYVADTMDKFADEIRTQEFNARTRSDSASKICGILLIISILISCAAGIVCYLLPEKELNFLFFIPAALTVIAFLALIIPIKSFSSLNTIAVKNPSGEADRRIVFLGNIDSPVERNLFRVASLKLEKIVTAYIIAGLVLCLALNLVFALLINEAENLSAIFALSELIFLPAGVFALLLVNPKQSVQGASGNLTGVFDSMAVIQYLTYNSLTLENTQVVGVSCGAGINGAVEFMKEYESAFRDMDTVYISVDTLQSDEHITVSGPNAGLLETAAENALLKKSVKSGKDILNSSLLPALANKKVPCARVSGADQNATGLYATREDTVSEISPMAIEAGLKLSLEAAYLVDEKGI